MYDLSRERAVKGLKTTEREPIVKRKRIYYVLISDPTEIGEFVLIILFLGVLIT